MAANTHPSVQLYLPIAQIRDDVVVLKDGQLRGVLIISSINFALKSEEEQEAIIQSYVGFLNSIDFSLQIVVNSRKLNIDGYLLKLEEQEKRLTNELLRHQIQEYRAYIHELISLGDIMAKRFFVVIPFMPGEGHTKKHTSRGFFSQLKGVVSASSSIKLKEEDFVAYREQLLKRVEYVRSGLLSMGLSAELLTTQSLIELFYSAYNPDISDVEKLSQVGDLRVE